MGGPGEPQLGEGSADEHQETGTEQPVETPADSRTALSTETGNSLTGHEANGDEQITEEVVEGAAKKVKGLPQNEWSAAYYKMKDELDKNPQLKGPISRGILAMLALISKYSKYADLIPGQFMNRISEDEKLKAEKLKEEEMGKILAAKKKDYETRKEQAEEKAKKEKKEKPEPADLERASLKYACNALWGDSFGIEDVDTLSAKLKNTQKAGVGENYFKRTDLPSLQRNGMPFGTVLVFTPNLSKATKAVAIATGNGGEFQYFDAEKGIVQTFDLKDSSSPIRSSYNLQAAFVPQFNSDPAYFAAHQDEVVEAVNDTPEGRIAKGKKLTETARDAAKEMTVLLTNSTDLETLSRWTEEVKMRMQPCFTEIIATLKTLKNGKDEEQVAFNTISTNYRAALENSLKIYNKYREALDVKQKEILKGAEQTKTDTEQAQQAAKVKAEASKSSEDEEAYKKAKEAFEAAINGLATAQQKSKSQMDLVDIFIKQLQEEQGALNNL